MGRASKFAFPLPGRRAHGEREHHLEPAAAPDYDYQQPSSKAERLLGTGLPGHRQGSYSSASGVPRNNSATPSLETKKSYMSFTLADERKGSLYNDDGHLVPPNPRFHQDQPSTRSKDRSASVTSSTYSRKLQSQGSSSTMRSHHDGVLRKGHPALHSSQSLDQESLRGSIESGKKKKIPARLDLSKLFPKAPKSRDSNDQQLLSPTKFVSSPMPMSSTSTHFSRPLTSPTTSSHTRAPSVSSTKTSDTLREGRAQAAKDRAYKAPFDNAKVNRRRPPPGIQHWFDGISDDDEEEEEEEVETPPVRASARPQESRSLPQRQPSQRDHRRRESPPRHARKPSHNKAAPKQPSYPADDRAHAADRSYASKHGYSNELHADPQSYRYRSDYHQTGVDSRSPDKPHVRAQPSQTSLASHKTGRTNTSKISSRDLKGDSVLSLSSSEDESDPRSSGTSLPIIRDSLAMSTDTEGEILIGRAQAFDIRPRQTRSGRRMTTASGTSVQSSGTGTTIDVMLSPTTAASSQTNLLLPRHSNSRSTGRRGSRHARQVSAIPEDLDSDSKRYSGSISNVSFEDKDTSSIRSGRTSKSEPRHLGHKLMAVTEEEEVLLELMRRKRAAMAKQSFTDGYRSAIRAEHHYMSMDSPISEYSSKQSLADSDRRHSKKSFHSQTTTAETETSSSTLETLSNATYVPTSRSDKKNRAPPTANEALLRSPASSSITSASSVFSSPRSRPVQRIMSQAPQLSPALFSPLEVFPSPPDSPNFPATASHTDTIPSPVTPGPGPHGDLHVKVAGSSIGGSEASFGTDQDSIHNAHHHHHPSSDFTMIHKGKERARVVAKHAEDMDSARGIDRARSHSRRRTASSGANVAAPCAEPTRETAASNFVVPPRTSSIMAFPKPGISIQQDDVHSVSSAASSKSRARPGEGEWDWDAEVDVGAVISQVRKSRSSHILGSSRTSVSSTTKQRLSRQNSTTSHVSSKSGAKSDAGDRLSVTPMSSAAIAQRSSVCDDVLAAWSSLGGSRGEFYG